jgi:hypothetical protein
MATWVTLNAGTGVSINLDGIIYRTGLVLTKLRELHILIAEQHCWWAHVYRRAYYRLRVL